MEDRGLCSFDTTYIWDESDLWIPWNQKPTSTPMYEAATTVNERHSQCSAVLSEISPTLCEDSFLTLLRSNIHVAVTSTRNSLDAATNQLVRNRGIGLEAAK